MENIFCPFTVFSADIPMLHVNTHEQLQQRAHFLCFPKIVKKSLFSCTMNGYFSECPFSDSHIARSRKYNTYIIQSAAHIAFMPPHSVILPKTWKECDWFFSRLSIVSKFPSFFFNFLIKIHFMHVVALRNSIFMRKRKKSDIQYAYKATIENT